jgi:alpha/beta superfamily hydrolase
VTEQPLLLPTSHGPIAAIAAIPDVAPRAAVLVVQGQGSSRAGINQTWSRLARSLAEDGLATLRSDYSGVGESWDADPRERIAGVRDLAHWFRERTDGAPLLIVASCYGLSPAAALARDGAGLLAAAVITPPLFFGPDMPKITFAKPKLRRILVKKARQLPRRAAYRLRYGPAGSSSFEQAEPGNPASDLEDLVVVAPTWIFAGSRDLCATPVRELLPRLQHRGPVELEIADDTALYGAPTPTAQFAIHERVRAWVHRCMTTVDAST